MEQGQFGLSPTPSAEAWAEEVAPTPINLGSITLKGVERPFSVDTNLDPDPEDDPKFPWGDDDEGHPEPWYNLYRAA